MDKTNDQQFETVGDIFIRRMDDLELKTAEVAEKLNFSKHNVISMIRSGRMRLPLNRVILASKVLDVDPVYMLRSLAHEMQENSEDDRLLEVLAIATGQEVLTIGEWEMVKLYRKHTHKREIVLSKDFPEDFELMRLAMEDVSKRVKTNMAAFEARKAERRRGPARGFVKEKRDFDITGGLGAPNSGPDTETPEAALQRRIEQEQQELRDLAMRKNANAG